MLYPGDTVRLLRAVPECALPRDFEAGVAEVRRNGEGEITAVEIEYYSGAQRVKAQVPFEAVELVISSSSLEQTAVLWSLEEPPRKLMEAAMHSLLDHGFLMRDGLNVARLRYDRQQRWWKWGEKLADPAGALVATTAAAWDGCVVAFSGRQRFHLEFRLRGRGESVVMLHERLAAYTEQARSSGPAMSFMRVLLNLCEAVGARHCAFPAAQPWLNDEDWRALQRPPLYPDLLLLPEEELPQSIATPFRLIRLAEKRAILTVLPVKSSPMETDFERSDRELKMDFLRKCKALGEKYYDQMYDARFGASGLYSDAKDAFYDAIATAKELGLKEEVETLEKRLDNIRGVVRSQF